MRLFVATFAEESDVLEATREARAAGFRVQDVYTPYPVHGMDEAMGLRPSRLTFACFALGLAGAGFALWLQEWTSGIDWPLNVGGKPLSSLPAFIPVAFEMTVLLAGLGTVAALFARARLVPRPRPRFLLPGVTRDRFALALEATGATFDAEAARALAERHGALAVDVVEARP
jgi:hypothetical protein